jgi:hypothetical protein
MKLSVDELARRYLEKIPPAVSGQGGHDQTFKAACALVKGFDLTVDQARPLLAEYNKRCQPEWSTAELEHKLTSADTSEDRQQRGWLRLDDSDAGNVPRSPPPKLEPKPAFRDDKLAQFAARFREFVDTAWLADRSPIDPVALTADDFLHALFRPNEQAVIFTDDKSQGQALWPAETIPAAGPLGVWFLNQPVDGEYHPNPRNLDKKTGEPVPSRRSEESVTSWRYLLLESDEARSRDWAAALVQLPLSIAAIYTSGGRSIHALVRVDAPSKHEFDNFARAIKPILVTIGADKKTFSAVRLTRLPGCWRHGKMSKQKCYVKFAAPALQKLLYLNPDPKPVAIISLPRQRDVLAALQEAAAAHLATAAGDVLVGVVDLNNCIKTLDNHRALLQRPREQLVQALEWFESNSTARDLVERLRRLPQTA